MAPVVSIVTITFNQASYLSACIEGVLNQKTDFPIEYIIHDDASTDGSKNIIHEYAKKNPNIIKPIFQSENQYSKHHSFSRILKDCILKAKGKYIAICEGDDYWIDEHKLKHQVEFLETHPEYGLVYTKAKCFNQTIKEFTDIRGGENETFEEFLLRNTIPTLTVLFKKSLFVSYIEDLHPDKKDWKTGDYPLWLYVAKKSKIKFIDEVTGVYRVLPESASHTKDLKKIYEFHKNSFEIKMYYIAKYEFKGSTEFINNLTKRKLESLFRHALVLNDKKIISEIKSLSRQVDTCLLDKILLSFPKLNGALLRLIYRFKGYKL